MPESKETITENKFEGSWGIVVLWVILCFPIAIVYYLMKCKKITRER